MGQCNSGRLKSEREKLKQIKKENIKEFYIAVWKDSKDPKLEIHFINFNGIYEKRWDYIKCEVKK